MKNLLTYLIILIVVAGCSDKKSIEGTWNFEAGDGNYMNYSEGLTKSIKYSFDSNQVYMKYIDTINGIELKRKDIYFYKWNSENIMQLNLILPIFIVDSPYVESKMNIYLKVIKNNGADLEFLLYDDVAGEEYSPIYRFKKETNKRPNIKRKDLRDSLNNIAMKDSSNYIKLK